MLVAVVCKTCQGENAVGAEIQHENSLAERLQPHSDHNHIVSEIRIDSLAINKEKILCISFRESECRCVEKPPAHYQVLWNLVIESREINDHRGNPG